MLKSAYKRFKGWNCFPFGPTKTPRSVLNPVKKSMIEFFRRSSHQRCSVKKAFLKILQNSQENTSARVSFLINLQAEPEIACNWNFLKWFHHANDQFSLLENDFNYL